MEQIFKSEQFVSQQKVSLEEALSQYQPNENIQEVSNSQNVETLVNNVAKSDKPKVELYIMSYCPYGIQAQK
jgi:hypothetical protein